MKTEVQTITPTMAKVMLGKNTKNRPVNNQTVRRYAKDMSDGKWKLNGEPIIVNGARLLDGQHRLLACIQAGASFRSVVVDGVASDTFDTIDQGDKRTAGNVLTMEGVQNATVMASAVRWIHVLRNSDGLKSLNAGAKGQITASATLDFCKDNPMVEESGKTAMIAYRECRALVPSLLAAMHFLFAEKDRELADEFIGALGTGEGLDVGDPRLTLRNRMIERAIKIHKERIEWMAVMHIYAWNAFRENRKLKKLMFREGDLVPKIV